MFSKQPWMYDSSKDFYPYLINHSMRLNGTNESAFRVRANDKLNIYDSGATRGQVTTTAVFRDVGQWYHVGVQLDLTDSTANDLSLIHI